MGNLKLHCAKIQVRKYPLRQRALTANVRHAYIISLLNTASRIFLSILSLISM